MSGPGRRIAIPALVVGALVTAVILATVALVTRPGDPGATADGSATASPSPVLGTSPAPVSPTESVVPRTTPVPASPGPSIPSATPIPSGEIAIRAFLGHLTSAIRVGDTAAMLAGLHPQVIRRYGEAACDAELASRAPDPGYTIDIVEIGPPERWAFESDGESRRIADAVTVIARVTAQGTSERREIHVATSDGAVRWFTDCGEPID